MAALTKNIIDTRLALYTLAAGALASGSAHAAPTTSPSSFPVSADDSTVNINIDGDGQIDFTLTTFSSDDCPYNGGSAYFNYHDAYSGGVLGGDYASMISDGSSVSGSSTFWYHSHLAACYSDSGEFPPLTRGFVGVKFLIDKSIHYGYMDVETKEGSLIATVFGACYESTPDTAIDVGACDIVSQHRGPVSVPVGGLIPLSLAALALGAAASRRRRKTQQ